MVLTKKSKRYAISVDFVKVVFILSILLLSTGTLSSQSLDNDKSTLSYDRSVHLLPDYRSTYKIISNNASLLQNLVYKEGNINDDEILDMLHDTKTVTLESKDKLSTGEKLSAPVEPENASLKDDKNDLRVIGIHENPKLESEFIQEDGADVEKDSTHHHNMQENVDSSNVTGRWAIMTAAILLTAAGTGYIGMILWRKSLERRYGSRQMLVEEDETQNEYKHSMV